MKLRHITIFLFLYTASLGAFGQGSFFRTDSVSYYGSKIIDNGAIKNAMQCEVEENKKSRIYSPNEVQEYRLGDGQVYISKSIQLGDSVKRVFLLQLVKAKTTLYVYNGKNIKLFYVEKDSTSLIELPKYHKENKKVDFRIDLSKMTDDCQGMKDVTKLVSYADNSMSKFISNYNICSSKPFPFIRYGFILGYGFQDLEFVGNNIYKFESFVSNRYKGGFLPGVFVDCPILMSYFSFHADVYFSKYGYSFTKTTAERSLDFVNNTTSIHMPLLVRYTFPEITLRPFVNAGLNCTYNFRNNTAVYNTLINPGYVLLQSVDHQPYVSKYQLGFSVGAGIEYKLNYKHSAFIELRYNKQLGLSLIDTFNNMHLQLLTSINI